MSRVYVVVGTGGTAKSPVKVEEKFLELMVRDSVYATILGNSLRVEPREGGKEVKLKAVTFGEQTVWMNAKRWNGYTKVRSLIDSGNEVVFLMPEKGGKYFYRGVASAPSENNIGFRGSYNGELSSLYLNPVIRRFEEAHRDEVDNQVLYQAVFPIDRWERVEATKAQKSVLLDNKGQRITWRGTFQVLKVPSAFSLSSSVEDDLPYEAAATGTDGVVEDDARDEVTGEAAGGGGVRTREEVEAELRVARLELELLRLR